MDGSEDLIDILVSPPPDGATARTAEPVRLGVPLADGWCSEVERLSLLAADGAPRLLQARSLDRWPSGAIRWILLDFLADHDGGTAPGTYRLARTGGVAAGGARVVVTSRNDAVSIATGRARFELHRHAGCLTGGQLTPGAAATLSIADRDGAWSLTVGDCVVEDAGPVRAVVRLRGSAGIEGTARADVDIRLHFFADSAAVRLDVTLRNPKAASHPEGIWELGEPNSLLLDDVAMTLAPAVGAGPTWYSAAPGGASAPADTLELFQASSGGAHWNLRTHADRSGTVPLQFRGFRLRADGVEQHGERATPIVWQGDGPARVAAAMPDFWQQFPKAVEASAAGLVLRLFPRQHGAPHELQPGEQKTHTLYFALGEDVITALPLDWARSPLFARGRPAHYCGTGAVPYLQPLADEPSPDYAALVRAAIEGPEAFELKREIIDEYGWRNFGDIYADHERVYYTGPPPVISHYNNQYDAIAGFARQFLRSGDVRWWRQLCQLARHVVDIDIYHTSGDKAAYNHGLFWHTGHYIDVGLSTHRSYPRAPGVSGGGPADEHNYAGGLTLHYFLTGEVASRDTVGEMASWVVAMDDGRQTPFRWLSAADTGLASTTYSMGYHGPGRGAGNSIVTLLEGHRVTGDRAFIDKADALIRRCVHPRDDVGAHGLLDSERRWSYPVFLHAVGRYLDGKVERSEIDGMYSYGCAALGHYADWMASHERPYLDRREELEYPTETWAAQELWKSEVFAYATKYGPAAGHDRYLERSDFFFDYAIRTLMAADTRTLTRPVVLLLSRGLMHGYVRRHPEALEAPAPPPADFGVPGPPFIPQKEIARRRAMALAAGAVLTATAAVAYWLIR